MAYDAFFDDEENKILIAICTRKLIKGIGIGGVIWGLINTALGVYAIQDSPINIGLLALGLLMLGTGVQALRKPTHGVLLAECISAFLLLAWNVSIGILNFVMYDIPDFSGFFWPLVFFIFIVNYYRKVSHLKDQIAAIDPSSVKATKKMCKDLIKKKLKDEPLVLQTSNRKCRVQLMDEGALFIQRDLMRAFIVPKNEIILKVEKPEARKYKLIFNHPVDKLKYGFDKKNTEKLKAWLVKEAKAAMETELTDVEMALA